MQGMQGMQLEKNSLFERTDLISGSYEKNSNGTVTETREAETGSYMVQSAAALSSVTYEKPGQEIEKTDIMSEASGLDAVQMKNKMVVASNSVTPEDASAMDEKDGFPLNKTDIKTVITETDKIKMELAKAGKDISCFGDDLSSAQIEAMAGSSGAAAQIEASLRQADLPVTSENVKDMGTALKMSDSLTDITDGSMKYMLDQNLTPTIENLYMAQYNGTTVNQKSNSSMEWDTQDLTDQVGNFLQKNGMDGNQSQIKAGIWLVSNDVSLTPEHINTYEALSNQTFPVASEDALTAMTQAITTGERPADAVLTDTGTEKQQAGAAMEVIQQTTDDDLKYVLDQGQELTIENLKNAHEVLKNGGTENGSNQSGSQSESGQESGQNAASQNSNTGLTLVKARRQLEETRLIMTTEANYKLLKQGVSIDTKPLAELVDQLKQQEQSYYKNLLEADGSTATQDQVQLFATVAQTTDQLKTMPSYALGSSEYINTLNSLHEAGTVVAQKMEQAGTAYETLMTAPRSDMGDSIQKAFQNVDDILSDLNLEQTNGNQRAVRILAYNQQEITTESVQTMKLADQQVQQAFDNMKPSVVREMIKEGMNPLQMDIQDLNQKAQEIQKNLGTENQTDKYSTYLWKLEQSQSITEEERESYIGVYRLMNQVEATDGAAVGAVVQQGGSLTMQNLLTAVRSGNRTGKEWKVDDNFGTLDQLNTNGTSITDQIDTAYQTECFKKISKTMEPDGMKQVMSQDNWQNLSPEAFLDKLEEAQSDNSSTQAYYESVLTDFKNCLQAEDSVYESLEQNQIPITMDSVMAMQGLRSNRNGAMKQFFNLTMDDLSEDTDLVGQLEEIKENILKDFGESIKTPKELAEAQHTLAEVAEHCTQTMMYSKGMTTLDLKQLQSMTKQLSLGAQMSDQENYNIPVLVQDGVANVSVKIVRGTGTKGLVSLAMESGVFGKLAAELKYGEKGITGYLATDSKDGYQQLMDQQEQLQNDLGDQDEQNPARIQMVYSQNLDLNHLQDAAGSSTVSESDNDENYQVQTKELYKIAEQMIQFLSR